MALNYALSEHAVKLLDTPRYTVLGVIEQKRLQAAHDALNHAAQQMTTEAYTAAADKFEALGYVFIADECRAKAKAITDYRAPQMQAGLAAYRQRIRAAVTSGTPYIGSEAKP